MDSPNLGGQSPYIEAAPVDDFMPIFYVGHHETKRSLPVSESLLRRAQDVGVRINFHFTLDCADDISMIC